MITLLFTDGDLAALGQPISRFIKVDVTLNFNSPASAIVTLPALPAYLEMAAAGNRLEIIRDGVVLCGGPLEYPGQFQWSADDTTLADPGVITIGSTDDSVWLGCRLVYPDPAHASTAQTADWYTLTATNAETAMRDLVDNNAGGSALSVRQVPNLSLPTASGVGTDINVRARFSVLSDELRAAAIAGGGLGYGIRRDSSDLHFFVYQPDDLTDTVRFSRGLGNLRSVDYQAQGPTADVAIVGGDGTGTDRTIVERTDSDTIDTWGRIEVFVNDSSDDTTDLDQAGDQALTDGAEQGQLSVVAIDTATQKFGVDYALGDKVSVEIYPGLSISDVVRAVNIVADDTGEVVHPQIGTASASTDQTVVRRLRAMERRLGQLERT